MILVFLQLSQAAASIENRVPTPSSVASAETNSQQPGPEIPMLEMKTEVKTEDTEPDASESKGEPASAVGAWMCLLLWGFLVCLFVCFVNLHLRLFFPLGWGFFWFLLFVLISSLIYLLLIPIIKNRLVIYF